MAAQMHVSRSLIGREWAAGHAAACVCDLPQCAVAELELATQALLLVWGLVLLQDRDALQIGLQQPAPGAASFTSALDCMTACDVLNNCAGFTLSMSVAQAKVGSTCRLVFGDASPQSKRTVYKTDITRMGLPSEHLCPSGFTTAEAGMQCVPITQGQAASFVLTATGSCGATASQSVQGAVSDFLSNPDNAFGECCSRA